MGAKPGTILMRVVLPVLTPSLIAVTILAFITGLSATSAPLSVSKVKTTVVKQKIRNPLVNAIAHIYSYALFLIYVVPVVLIILFSFTDSATIAKRYIGFSSLTLDNYIKIFTKPPL